MAYSSEFWEVVDGAGGTRLSVRPAGPEGGGVRENGEEALWHTVARGDTLWELARRYGVELSRIVELNPSIRNPNLIYAGQRVRIR